MQYLLILTFLFTHPLDNGPFREIDFSGTEPIICRNNVYISPINGIVEEIIENENKYTVKISNDIFEIVFVDLDCVYKDVGEKIIIGDEIGKDNGITIYNEFAIIQYNTANDFPQFKNNKLQFYTNIQDTPIYSMNSGIVSMAGYDVNLRGNFIEISSQIQYWHLRMFYVGINDIISKNERISAMGNTGLSIEPHLTVFFTNEAYDIKAIYIKSK
jgi:hypothetical protein